MLRTLFSKCAATNVQLASVLARLNPVMSFVLLVVMDVIDSRQVSCKLYKGPSDALICTDDFITKVVHR